MHAGRAGSIFMKDYLGYLNILLVCCAYLTVQTVNGQCNCATDCASSCSAGQYYDSGSCVTCPQGKYCTGGANPAQDCSAGTFNGNTGSTSSSACQNCAAGYHSGAGASSCTQCPQGTSCANPGTATPTNCLSGTYSGVGATSCTTCPLGSFCAGNQATSPVACTSGYYTPSTGASSCTTQCPAGSQCPSGTSPVQCLAGTYSQLGEENCTPCPAGKYSASNGASSCTTCDEGHECPTPGMSSPTACSAGYIAAAGSSSCTLCANDKRPDSDSKSCEDCPAGHACTNSANSPTPCTSGYYALTGAATCTQCPVNSKCPTTTASPVACAADEYAPAGSTVCTQCPAGFTCSGGTSTQCSAGEYSPAGGGSCLACTAGNYCPAGATSETPCATGTYSAANAGSCTICPAGSYCPDTQTVTACASGQYSEQGAQSCTDCPAGSQCMTLDSTPTACPSGTYNLATSATGTACIECPGGYYCAVTTTSPVPCDAGYISGNGSTECIICPAGFACPDIGDPGQNFECADGTYSIEGETTCSSCNPGFYCPTNIDGTPIACPPGFYSGNNQTQCTRCDAGFKCPNTDGSGIVACVAGSYSEAGATDCIDCPKGYACPLTDTSQIDECPVGTYSVGKQTECTPCPAGKRCPTTKASTEIDCVAGTYSIGNQSTCIECPVGYECPVTDDNSTTACEPGYFALGAQAACTLCPEGEYCATTIESGIPCDNDGEYSVAGSTNCTTCEAGFYCPNFKASFKTQCPAGTYSTAGSTACLPCDAGYRCQMQSDTATPLGDQCDKGGWCDGEQFHSCDAGTYNPLNTSTSAAACVLCPSGYYCEGPGEIDYSSYDCPNGHYCLEGTTSRSSYPCPGGTYNNGTNLVQESDCTNCPQGFYCPEGSTNPIECPPGFFCALVGMSSGAQTPCPAGTYSNGTGLTADTQCIDCPVGSYCPGGQENDPTTEPVPCPAGTYNPSIKAVDIVNCHQCEKGFACNQTGMDDSTILPCKTGYYCPFGTIEFDQFPCLPGSYGDTNNLTSADECKTCPAGWICGWATTDFGDHSPPDPCAQGHYCPEMTTAPDQYPCPAGTFTNASNLFEESQCTPCTAGYYCTGGNKEESGICPRGYYCPLGTTIGTEFGCPNGTYNDEEGLTTVDDCKNCTQGHYCEFAVSSTTPCAQRTYMPYGVDPSGSLTALPVGVPAKRQFECLTCPGGSTCLNGTIDPVQCTTGFYSPDGAIECTVCEIGHYCDNDTTSEDDMRNNMKCPAGRYCVAGLSAEPDAVDCATGHYCPEATVEMINCPVGTMRTTVGAGAVTDCEPCTAGYYCLEESSGTTGACIEGYYCPTNLTNPYGVNPPYIGSYGNDMYKCPEGTYTNVTATPDLASCLECPAGYFCGLATNQPEDCTRGYYCPAGSEKPTPCPIGTYGNDTNLVALDKCTDCDRGYYCDAPGLTLPRDQCDPGYLCYSKATTSTPTEVATQGGELCSRGGYCVRGSYEAAPCPLGTYSNITGAIDTSECTTCDPGYYCSSVAGGEPTGPCAAGFYCEQGSSSAYQFSARPGHFTNEGARAEEECPIATYAPFYNSSSCSICPAGFYCPDKAMNYTIICPVGTYCPEGSYQYYTCPPGTFLNETGKSSLSDCVDCPTGYYCQDRGLSEVTGPCKAGHICYLNGLDDDPVYNDDNSTGLTIVTYGDRCHPGFYCPQGTTYMVPCPEGTYREHYSGASVGDCTICDPGKYCDGTNNTGVTGDCDPGYYCNNGSHIASPVDGIIGNICPQHKYCPQGADVPKSCQIGYMANRTGMDACELCIAGYICYPDQAPVLCPQGKYCVASTVLIPITAGTDCPKGTYGAAEGLESLDNCTACDAGFYCETAGLTNVTGPITAGYWALTGAEVATPVVDDNPDYGLCPRGHYCPEQSTYPTPCPAGTYGPSEFVTSLAGCVDCDPGYYCPTSNMSTTGSQCTAGYYCTSKSSEAAPVNASFGDICPTGHYCPTGASEARPCTAGTYADTTGKSSCDQCPQGFYCPLNTTDPISCPMGYYCIAGQASEAVYPCPVGKFNNLTERYQASDCVDCPPGYYCDSQGLGTPTGQCDPGWYCTGASVSAQPTVNAQGGVCVAGTYCPIGSAYAIPCDPGQFCANDGQDSSNGTCSAGYYCSGSSISATPTGQSYGDICPAGKYCPEGSPAGINCPPGTFMNTTGATAESECFQCTQGYYCDGYGNTAVDGQCDEGYFCPPGMNSSNPAENICGQGHYCPMGSHEEIRCLSGLYQDETGQSTCKMCPEGYYCDNAIAPVILFNNTICLQGYYCPNGTQYSTQFRCPVGTYGNSTGLTQISECTPCPGGYYCDQEAQTTYTELCNAGYYCRQGAETGTPMEDDDAYQCPVGHYCPIQTSEPQKCPAGTYSNNVRLTAESECTDCPAGSYCGELNMTTTSGLCYAGYYCPNGSSSPTELDCPKGHYCGNGTGTPSPCPKGTYSNQTNLMYQTECDDCPGGYYCLEEGLTEPSGLCGEGYYCPVGTIYQQPNTTFCPVGHYCPNGSSQALPCTNYTEVNHTHAVECNQCPAGFYCDSAIGEKTVCPAGYYCPAGTGLDWQACPRGTYSNTTGLHMQSQCTPCEAGKYCETEHLTEPTGDCAAGYYCTSGVDMQRPNGTNTGTGDVCPLAHYCPAASPMYLPCENGTYANSLGQTTCDTCVQGHYCPDQTDDYTSFPCPQGHYCPDGTREQFENPCPKGTFNNATYGTTLANCYTCTSGMYCQTDGLSDPTGLCSAGYYCDGGSETPTPTGAGGGYCTSGYYCPEGSTEMTPCTPGHFCASDYLNETSGPCQDGYYCISAATIANPTDGTTGDTCPMGSYCPAGSSSPTPCTSGTYLDSTGNYNETDCISCTAGQYCAGSGNIVPDGNCSEGYYCPGGKDTPTPVGYECTQGHFCKSGYFAPERCPSGNYQDDTGQSDCKGCPAGYFCDNTFGPVVLYNNSACPVGYYCPENTTNAYQYPCPTGTFSNVTNRVDSSECQACSGGMYCSQTGLSEPEGLCDAGYFCTSGSNSKTPSMGSNADTCTIGNYCPNGTTTPQQCPPGSYNPSTGRQTESQCLNCTGGYYCGTYGMTSVPNGNRCTAGYYCPGGADNPTYIVCPEGNYCPTGTEDPEKCPSGTFSNATGLTSDAGCEDCIGGYYCPSDGQTEASDLCWGGYYCPAAQKAPNPSVYTCPKGMQCPNGSSDYQACPAGTYTSATGMSSCDTCPAGFYCLPVIPANASLNAQSCPQGYYCPAGTGIDWQACPAGTYGASTGLQNETECTQCDSGKYCTGTALSTPSGDCTAGHFCTSGVDTATPDGTTNTGTGGICAIGHYCPTGSPASVPCVAGTFTNQTQQATCETCPAGYYCMAASEEYLSFPCPAGHYCPAGTKFSTEHKCDEGTYNSLTGSQSVIDCTSCPGGQYCQGEGNSAPTGYCYAGWYCSGGSKSPNTTTHGGKCSAGYYCPANSSDPIKCDPGKYCQTEGLSAPTGDCLAGYFCTLQASTQTPTDGTTGDICPAGFYCETGVSTPTPCSPGTYSAGEGNTLPSDCLNCTAGEFCGSYNLTATDGDCDAGYYCPIGEITSNRLLCWKGYYCPQGIDEPIICPNGEYQALTGQATCDTCPGGYYCDNSNGIVEINSTILCPTGYFCPPGTPRGDLYPCDIGTFNNNTGLNASTECTPCIAGSYCETAGLTLPTGLCDAGYYCKVGATTASPSQGTDANKCPQGSYCVSGTEDPVPCPAGTYGAATKLKAESECTQCTAGYYCTTPGLLSVEGQCEEGYYCETGSNSSQEYICTAGHYCEIGTDVPDRCPVGTFSPYTGLVNSTQCTACTTGQYCGSEGLNDTTGPCSAGYYCPEGQSSATPGTYECTLYHYCPEGTPAPIPCANGTYMNHTQGSVCYTCPAGWYCVNGDVVGECPMGYYCPEQTDFNWQQCPPGTYNNDTALQAQSDCKSCPGGKYCSSYAAIEPTGDCDAGYYCEFGLDRANPIDCDNNTDAYGLCLTPGAQTGKGSICPLGYYCPAGSPAPEPCPLGHYSNVTGMETCTPCPAGYYCDLATPDFNSYPCPAGYYCPAGTYYATTNPCPAGTYYNHTLATEEADCIFCPPGSYCDSPGQDYPTGVCDAGYYCTNASTTATPTLGAMGGPCDPGYYCPSGSGAAVQCDPGTFCQTSMLALPTGNCTAGYYCVLQASSASPTDGTTGDICPKGHYCPQGSSSTTPCETGYFLNVTGSDDITDCVICTGGMYCPGTGNEDPAGSCDPGYYCPVGQNVSAPADYNCPVGHYCPGGTDAALKCLDGEYQTQETQTTCDICPAGYYCDNTVDIAVVNASTLCPGGHYCPQGTRFDNEFPCPEGTFNNNTGFDQESDCVLCLGGYACPVTGMTQMDNTYLCEAGYYCKQGANSTTPNQGTDANICPEGFYCPQGTTDPVHCPKGTYSNQTGLDAEAQCQDCPAGQYCDSVSMTTTAGLCSAGYYCEIGSNQTTEYICPAGSYCPEGSPHALPCPAGTYSNTQGMTNSSSCTLCDPGKYCNDTGLTSPVADCDAGFYCPEGSSVPNPNDTVCPIGLHCPVGTGTPVPCESGTYTNLTQQDACITCPEGFYCVPSEVIVGNPQSGYALCPAGFYCPAGTGMNWTACPLGTFSSVEGLKMDSECQQCTGGKYCDRTNLTSPAGDCDAGFFCTSGVETPQPDGSTNLGTGGICPPGSKCPTGTDIPDDCLAGTYQDLVNQADCTTCPAGYYCLAASTNYTDTPCPTGHYCPNGTQSDTQFQCPQGTFNNLTGQQSIDACMDCTPGSYCGTQGLSEPTGICDPGWYCELGSFLAQPTSPEGGKCVAGTYCPAGSSAPTGCDPGSYCGSDMLDAVTGNCSAGYYCSGNSTTPTPSGTGGDGCPVGHFCISGSSAPTPCDPGTFLPSTKAQDQSYCISCTAGKYCSQSGLSAVEGDCTAGYYCPAGQITSTPSSYECPAGHKCPAAVSTYTICPSGTYQDETRQSTCKTCMQGYYCDNSGGAITNYTTTVCPTGHYCPNGTQTAYANPCPAGTFSQNTGLIDASECDPCTGGYYCVQGTTTPTLLCSAGYYCRNSSQTAAPTQGPEANECPVGHYCPEQTTEPIKCPIGTFSNAVRLMNETDCTQCTQGYYCDAQGLTAPTGLCAPGFYCETGSDNDSPVECPAGKYCPEGTHTPTRCPTGTFSNATRLDHADNCTQCTAGFYCTTTGLTEPQGNCTQGYYCVTGSVVANPTRCPKAFHCPEGSSAPQECPEGSYTTQTTQYECVPCPQGYYCVYDNAVQGDVDSVKFDCPRGYYCPQGTGHDWQPCPAGTFGTQKNYYQESQCTDCSAGKYCDTEGATAVTGPCSAGYWCQSGVDRPNPDNDAANTTNATCGLGGHTGVGSICPIGSYCPEGIDLPINCGAGTYQDEEGRSYCKGCPEGFYCPANTSDYSINPCPSGHYCPENTTSANEYPCSIGTFNPNPQQTNSSSCALCTGGQYCSGTGLSAPTGNCSGGWYCIEGAVQPKPTVNAQGGKCKQRYYCPEGSDGPTICGEGVYCQTERLDSPSGLCDAGYWCNNGSNWNQPYDGTTGGSCPYGHYCPQGSAGGVPCPMGYFLNAERSTSLSSCTLCSPGKYCETEGLQLPTGDCDPGYYCPGGQSTPTPANYSCPEGSFCAGGLSAPVDCPSGQYQDLPIESSCKTCPEGYYCDSGIAGGVSNYTQYICPEGSYCPAGTTHADQHLCPLGTFNNATGLTHSDNCTDCVGGMACDETGLTYPKRECSAGYFCISGAQSMTPVQGANADVCPTGSYCPQGTADPVPCPEGSYNPSTGLQMESQCLNCTGGNYCNETGLSAVVGPCFAGFYCPTGSLTATEEQCTVGNYCPVGTEYPVPCPNGTFSNNVGNAAQTDCSSCNPRYYCNGEGLTNVTGLCKEGYYCPSGSSVETEIICPIGKYCPTGSADPADCPAGTYTAADGQFSCASCPAGYYCVAANVVAGDLSSVITACPAGYYCPNGTGYDWQPCPAGTYSDVTGLTKESECTSCLGGYFCSVSNLTGPSGYCAAGYYCVSGVDKANPTMLDSGQCPNGTVHPIVGDVCPIGHYCPEGTDNPIGCPAGTYQDLTNQDHCKACPAGKFCPGNTTDPSVNDCPSGHYCLENTTHANEYPCPAQTFNNLTGGQSLDDCQWCLPGMYCSGSGNIWPTGDCAPGYYCTNGSDTATPTLQGGRCSPGTYCPAGASYMYNCTLGMYCSQSELSAPEGFCDEGYYCPGAATSPQEYDCPVGNFCPNGTGLPQPCRNGTYAPTTNLKEEGECTPCDGGFYCNGTGLSAVSGQCDAGFYCPPGQTQPDPYDYRCTPGYFCIANSPDEVICPSGQYQDEYQQDACKNCPAGYFCDNAHGAIGNLSNYECPTGYYCPGSVVRSNEYPCIPGTYNNVTMLTDVSQCQPCLPGYYCQNAGLTESEGLCYPGYYCNGSTIEPNPSYAICPIGNYCPEGSYEPTPCPSGTIATGTGNSNLTDCEPCKPGNYCTAVSSQNGFSLPCNAGYICKTGSDVANPTDGNIGYICPAGYYCLEGAVLETACPRGQYQPQTGQGECKFCEAGTSCPDLAMNQTLPCPAGYYCLNGTVDNGEPCPTGTYNPSEAVSASDECLPCGPGEYCNVPGLSAPAGNCSAGYLCLGNATTPTPDDGVNGPCPIAHYCDEGTTASVPCPLGTMRNETHGAGRADCYPCAGGKYCNALASTGPAGVCDPGYYCPSSADIDNPQPTSYLCPAGFYCLQETADPIGCDPGTYQPNQGETSCLQCTIGHYCPQNTSIPVDCPAYSYCPVGSATPLLCPNGTYTADTTTGLEKPEDCADCVSGSYCTGGNISGPCSAGFICYVGMGAPDPDDSYMPNGGPCPYGYYCTEGIITPAVCPPNSFISKTGAVSQAECQPCPGGSICVENSTVAEPCWAGWYCRVNEDPEMCPNGTYNDKTGMSDSSACLPCPAGYFCDSLALANYTVNPCPLGYFCPNATIVPESCPIGTYRDVVAAESELDCFPCPAGSYCPDMNMTYSGIPCVDGTYCPEGAAIIRECRAGYYCNNSETEISCPPAYYCPENSTEPTSCPSGSYCTGNYFDTCNCTDAGAIEPTMCPPGYGEMIGALHTTFDDTCSPCIAGTYSNSDGQGSHAVRENGKCP